MTQKRTTKNKGTVEKKQEVNEEQTAQETGASNDVKTPRSDVQEKQLVSVEVPSTLVNLEVTLEENEIEGEIEQVLDLLVDGTVDLIEVHPSLADVEKKQEDDTVEEKDQTAQETATQPEVHPSTDVEKKQEDDTVEEKDQTAQETATQPEVHPSTDVEKKQDDDAIEEKDQTAQGTATQHEVQSPFTEVEENPEENANKDPEQTAQGNQENPPSSEVKRNTRPSAKGFDTFCDTDEVEKKGERLQCQAKPCKKVMIVNYIFFS